MSGFNLSDLVFDRQELEPLSALKLLVLTVI
uniref:Uncharacterized protein n=1 Tax=Nelumbo nucifera TaxID=4432 RepID=A0A822XUL8_NELNU|nr:TPA_asm: hypothetical protein HUJ06_026788 [Nelumbo nucifera]